MDSNITLQTKQMIDSLKAVCTNFGLGNASSEYKIITEVSFTSFSTTSSFSKRSE